MLFFQQISKFLEESVAIVFLGFIGWIVLSINFKGPQAIESSRNAEIYHKITSSLLAYVSSMSWWKMYISQFFFGIMSFAKQNKKYQNEPFLEMCIWRHESNFFYSDISTSAKLFWNVNSFSQHPIWDICCHFLALNMLKGRGILKWRQLQKIIDFLIKMWYHFFRGVIEKWPYRWPMGGRVKKISKWRCRHLLIAPPLKYLHT